MNNPERPLQKALTFRASSIGDALNAKYFLENVHAAYPDARCAIVVAGRAAMICDLLAAYPWIEVIEANRTNFRSLISLWRAFRRSDLVVIPAAKAGASFSLPSKLAARLLARRGALVGFEDASGMNAYLYDRTVPLHPMQAPRLSEQDALRAARIPIAVPQMRLAFVPAPALLERLQLEPKKYITVHLFAGSENRGPSQRKRQEVLDMLARSMPHTPLVLTGSAAERVRLDALALPERARVVAGDLSVQELAALMAQSACVVSVGSGPSHIASSLSVPVLVLVTCHGVPWVGEGQYGEGAEVHIFSDTASCIGGHDHSQPHPACIEGVDAEAVAHVAARYVAPVLS